MVRLFINIGKKQRVRPGDILGAIAGESGMDGKLIGTIDMYDKYTLLAAGCRLIGINRRAPGRMNKFVLPGALLFIPARLVA